MYAHKSTLITDTQKLLSKSVLLQNNIQILDKSKDHFYGAFKTSKNGPLVILPCAVKPTDIPHVQVDMWERLAVSVFKSSVLFLTADKRGIQIDCHTLNKRVTLFIEWEKLGVVNFDKSHLDGFLGFIRQGLLKYHFKEIVGQPNIIRKALFKVINSVSPGLFERYDIGNGISIETGHCGYWNVRRGNKNIFYDVCLEQLTCKVLSL